MKNKLFILYVLVFFSLIGAYAQTTIVLKPGADQGKDAMIFSCAPCGYNTLNFGTTSEISAMAWTNSGSESNSRGLIEFDLNIIPANSVITNAKLSLYFNSSSSNSSHSKTSGSNASLLQRITQTWDEKTVTWENQPTTTVLNQVVLSQSTTSNQNYTDIDVTDLVIDMKNNPDQSFGFLLKLETESYYRSLIFASSDNTDPTLHPKLEITYNLPNGKNDIVNSRNWQLYPNPNNGRFLIKNCNDINFIEIYNNIGAKVYSLKNKLHIYNGIDVSALEKGIYLVKISNGAKTDIQKLFIR